MRDRLATGALFISFSRRGTNSLRVLFSRLLALPGGGVGRRGKKVAALRAPQHLMTQEATFAQCVMLEVAERIGPHRIGRVSWPWCEVKLKSNIGFLGLLKKRGKFSPRLLGRKLLGRKNSLRRWALLAFSLNYGVWQRNDGETHL